MVGTLAEARAERDQKILAAVWDAWLNDRHVKFRDLCVAVGQQRTSQGGMHRVVQRLVERGFMAKTPVTGQAQIWQEKHAYTRGERLAGIDKRTGRVGRVIDETKGWY